MYIHVYNPFDNARLALHQLNAGPDHARNHCITEGTSQWTVVRLFVCIIYQLGIGLRCQNSIHTLYIIGDILSI